MDSTKIKALIVFILALFFALYLGIAAATAQLEVLAWVGGGLFLILCLLLGRHVWILIPATLGMQGGLNFIPGSPAPWHLMTAVVAGFTLLRIAIRQQRIHIRWTGMETVVLLVGLTVLQAMLRNPVGLAMLGGDSAGSKPYFIFGVAIVAFFLISTADANFRTWQRAVMAYLVISLLDSASALISGFSASYAQTMIRFYSNISYDAANTLNYNSNITDIRITEFAPLAGTLGLIACTFWRPLGALDFTKPWRAVVAFGAVTGTLLSGFRTTVLALFVNFILGSVLRRKPIDAVVCLALGIVLAAVVVIAVPSSSLPFSVQRVFSFIPGYARTDIAKEAKSSEDFRFEMWELALTTDKYIHNKLLGDGFQFSRDEYNAREAMRLKDYRLTGGMNGVDMMMITGSYHGFHMETIRFTGVVGLIAATAALIVFAVFAYRCIRAYRDQPGWGHVIFVCMPYLTAPLWTWLVFGDYKSGFPMGLALAGMVKLLYTIHQNDQATVTASTMPANQPPASPHNPVNTNRR